MSEQMDAAALLNTAKALGKEAAVSALNEQTPEEAPAPAPEQTQAQIHTCPRCAMRLIDENGEPIPTVTVSEEDKKEFLRRTLAGQRFTKELKMYNGQISVTFSTLSARESKDLTRVLHQIRLDDALLDNPQATGYELKMRASIRRLEMGDRTFEYSFTGAFPEGATLASVKAQCDVDFGEQDEWLTVSLATAYGCFERLMQLLMEEAFSENFWKGAGLS